MFQGDPVLEKVLLHMDSGNKESYSCWLDLRNTWQRSKDAAYITSDGAPA